MASLGFIIADYVCPTIGCIMSTLTFMAPIKSLQSAIKSGNLGSLNPTPWIFMTGNCIGWLAYSYIVLDLFVFFANAPGLLISLWLNIGAMKLQYYEEIIKYSSIETTNLERNDSSDNENEDDDNICHRSPPSFSLHERKLLSIVIIWITILSTISLMSSISKEEAKFIVGVAVNINLIFFYAAPLSTIVTVVKTKSSDSIHIWTMIMNTVNAFFWCVYSLAIQDYYILLPNSLGFMFGLVQMGLYRCYPSTSNDDSLDERVLSLNNSSSTHINTTDENTII